MKKTSFIQQQFKFGRQWLFFVVFFSIALAALPTKAAHHEDHGKDDHSAAETNDKHEKNMDAMLDEKLAKLNLPEQKRVAVKAAIKNSHERIVQLHQQKKALKKERHTLLTADKLDEKAIGKNKDAMANVAKKMSIVKADMMIDVAKILNADERKAFAEQWEMGKKDHHGKEKGQHCGDMDDNN